MLSNVEVEKLLLEEDDALVDANAQSSKEEVEQEKEPDIGPIVESVELQLDVVALHYMVNFLPGLAVEDGNLPWLEEEMVEVVEGKGAVEEMVSRDQRLFEVVEVVREREQLVVMVDVESEGVSDSRLIPEWSVEVANLCGLEHMEVLNIIEDQMTERSEKPESTAAEPFPWQLVPSQWEMEEVVRKEKQKERKAEEAAEMWKKQALMMSLPKDSTKETSSPKPSGSRSSSYGSRTSTYFDTSVVQVIMAV